MFSGNGLWPKRLLDTMTTRDIQGKKVETFEGNAPSLYHALLDSVRYFGNNTAIVDNWNSTCSFRKLLKLTDEFAAALHHKFEVGKGDHVALVFYNSIEFCVAFLALNKLGAVAVPMPSKYKQPELLALVEKAGLHSIICDECFAPWFAQCVDSGIRCIESRGARDEYGFDWLHPKSYGHTGAAGREESSAILMFTSGTTSRSKAVELKNYQVMHAVEAYRRILQITDQDRTVVSTPIYHITGIVALVALFLRAGGVLYLHRKFDAQRVLRCAVEQEITFFHASPTVFALLLDHRDEFPRIPSLRTFACGSSNMPVENIRRIKEWLPDADFHTVYGLTETTSPATIMPTGAAYSPFIGSSGIPIPGVDVKIIGEARQELENGKTGEICLRGTVVLERYHTGGEDAFTEDGWLRTGDLGYVNDQGYLYVVDRIKDMINRGGEKISSFDVENAIHGLPGVAEAAVVGVPSDCYGEEPMAVIRMEKGHKTTEGEIRDALKPMLAGYQIPVRIKFVHEILKTPNGKVDKNGIRELFIQMQTNHKEEP